MAKLYTSSVTATNIVDDPANGDIIGKGNSQLLYGEGFEFMGEDEHWIHGRSIIDGYEGYVHKSKMRELVTTPTHYIHNLMSHIYPKPDFKTHPVTALSFLSRVSLSGQRQNGFVKLQDSGWIFESHIVPLKDINRNNDFVEAALRFKGVPYLYGGRSAMGIDCSGLVQMAMMAAGMKCPRDSHQQADALGQSIEFGDTIQYAQIQRRDLIFFKGHVGIMTDKDYILNATARSMDTRIEPLETVSDFYDGIIGVRRIQA